MPMTEKEKQYFRDYYAKNRVRLLTNRGTYGKPSGAKPIPFDARFWGRVNKTETCWLWLGAINHGGYGRFTDRSNGSCRGRQAHRIAYEEANGPIPKGMQIDHLCRVRRCVNPVHMEVVSPRVNTLRGNTLPAANAAKTHCSYGHQFTVDNTYHTKRGQRYCRTCNRRRVAEWHSRQ